MHRAKSPSRHRLVVGVVLAATLALPACGGRDDSGPPYAVDEVLAAYEAAGGVAFEPRTDLGEVPDAELYGPPSLDPASPELERLNESLGNGAVLFQVFILTGDDPLTGRDAADAVTPFTDIEPVGEGVFEGEHIRLVTVDNVVIQGPPTDNGTFEAFAAVIEGLGG